MNEESNVDPLGDLHDVLVNESHLIEVKKEPKVIEAQLIEVKEEPMDDDQKTAITLTGSTR